MNATLRERFDAKWEAVGEGVSNMNTIRLIMFGMLCSAFGACLGIGVAGGFFPIASLANIPVILLFFVQLQKALP